VSIEANGARLEEQSFPGRQGRLVFAYLLAEEGRSVPRDELAQALWGDVPPARWEKALSVLVSKLRGLLETCGIDGQEALRSAFGCYQLVLPPGTWIDVAAAREVADRAEAALGAGDLDDAREAASEAAALARRGFLPGEDAAWIEEKRRELGELLVRALECLADACLAAGEAREAVRHAEELTVLEPFREGGYRRLMQAHAAAGDSAEALRVYERCRRLLADELGAYPSPETQSIYRALLRAPPPEVGATPVEPVPVGAGGQMLAQDPAIAGDRPPVLITAPREERKVVTVFFAELADFTATAEQLDPEDVRAILRPHYARIRSEVERFGGRVETFVGDTMMALFGAHLAHEDDPERAVRAALAIRDSLAEQNVPQRVRIAVATGEAHVTFGGLEHDEEPVAVGDVLNKAARLHVAAPENGVVVGEQTFHATRHAIEYRGLGPVAARGKSAPVGAWEAIRVLARPGDDPSRHRNPFVGRARELAALQERLDWAVAERSPQLVTILGVPGIGKTRLVSELQRAATASDELGWHRGRSLPYGEGVSFWALGEMVKEAAGILESDTTRDADRKVRHAVDRTVAEPAEAAEIATYLGALIGLAGAAPTSGDRRSETFAAWGRFLESLADERPLVLVFEDVHWADDALLDFVDELVDRVSGVPLLVVATARPELLDRRPEWAGGKTSALTISLPPLSESDTTRLVEALLETSAPESATQEVLLARIGGNPLYAEQFCRILLEHGRLDELPQSLHGIIAARLDALADPEKRLLQDAAIVGRVFWVGALETIGGISRTDAERLLQTLVRREFVQRERRSSVADDIEFAFRHELLREVAYEEIPRAARAERHRRAAEWIESLGRPEDHAELLAHHYLAALDSARAADTNVSLLVERAVHALHQAGLRAIRLSANERAVEHLSRAITLIEQLPESAERDRTETELQLQLGVALFALRGLGAPEVERAYSRAMELMMASAPAAEQFQAQFGLTIYYTFRGHFDRSLRLVERLTDLAGEGDDSMRLQALHARWMNSLFAGRIDDAIAAADEALAIYRAESHHPLSFQYGNHDPGVCALALQALALAFRGESVKAVTQMDEAIALSEVLGHAATVAQPLTQLPWALQINGDAEAALRESDRALGREGEIVHPQFFGIAHAMRGWALSRIGRDQEGVAELERALAAELQASDIWTAMIGTLLAEVHVRHRRKEAARGLLDRVRSLTQSMPTYFYEPEIFRVEAEWLRLDGREDESRRLLLRAIATAREQGSWALAVRSALALPRLSSATRDADLKLLADVFDRLPAENETDYARDARALLAAGAPTAAQ
jgi:class 3 adenylate cyclase/DNA-binding SARP family transcriptional activator